MLFRAPHRAAQTGERGKMDLNALLKLASNPQIRSLVTSLLGQHGKGGGAQPVNGANMAGLVDNLKSAGLGDQVKSWVGTGDNKAVTAAQMTQAIGADKIQKAALDAGLTPQAAADDLAKVLPSMIDQATPNGKAPSAKDFDTLLQRLMGGSGASTKAPMSGQAPVAGQ